MSLNKIMLIGHLGNDPEIRYSQQGTAMVNFSLATSEKWKDKNSGEQQKKTEWHKVKIFGKAAETLSKFCNKGSRLYVEGSLETRSYDKDGQTHYITEIKCFKYEFLDNKGDQGAASGNENTRTQTKSNNQPLPDDDLPF